MDEVSLSSIMTQTKPTHLLVSFIINLNTYKDKKIGLFPSPATFYNLIYNMTNCISF